MKQLIILLLLLLTFTAFGQQIEQGKKIEIISSDNTKIFGSVISQDEESIILKTEYGESKVLKSGIKRINYFDEDTKYNSSENIYSGSHYLFNQSAFGLKEGESYYENVGVFLNSYSMGFSDNFSMTFGAELLSLLLGRFPSLFITPKFSIPFKGGAFSVYPTIATAPQEDFQSFGFLQSALTIGNLKDNFTVSAGIGFSFSDGFADEIIPITLSGMTALGSRVSLVTENWLFTDGDYTEGFLSLGCRIRAKKSPSFLTVSLWRITEDMGDLIAWPMISGTVKIK